ncbi:MAG: hypothetical protein ACRDQA_11795 [Nocardioidaceae bacterium]
MTTTPETPASVRQLDTPASRALADLAAVLDDLQTVLRCCERLVTELAAHEPDDLIIEALWTTTLLSYSRCFTNDTRGVALTEDDLTATSLHGEVTEWHGVLSRLREHYTDPAANPRERFSVGAARNEDGDASGIAITSTRQPRLDETTVRQTGALAYQLAQRVEQRITEHQEHVRTSADALSAGELDNLPRIDLADAGPGTADR